MKWVVGWFRGIPSKFVALFFVVMVAVMAIALTVKEADPYSYVVSAAFFIIGIIVSYNIAAAAGVESALAHFKDVVVGSTNIGLTSIKKLSDTPPESISKKTKSSFRFFGIAGEKFLKETLEKTEFFRRNKTPGLVKIMLMDPFSNDLDRLSADKGKQRDFRNKIISTIKMLNDLRENGYHFELRLYPKKPPLRLLIVDGVVTALSVYEADSSGWKNAQLIFEGKDNDDSLAPYFVETFDDLWERGVNINLDQRAGALYPFRLEDQSLSLLRHGSKVEKVKIGMVHGRFQPFHHEHFEYVLHGISKSEFCIIGITQPDIKLVEECQILPHRGTLEGNPYSFEDRKRMITLSLTSWGVSEKRYKIVPFKIDCPAASLPEIKLEFGAEVVHFMRVFSEWEEYKKKLIEDHDMVVEVFRPSHSDYMTKNVTGTLVRELISSRRNWKDFVPFGTRMVVGAMLGRSK